MNHRELFSLEHKIALVTGASSGLGEHFAEVLAAAGATVVLAARRTDRLANVVSRIEAAGGCAHALVMDVTSAQSVQQGFTQLDEMFDDPARALLIGLDSQTQPVPPGQLGSPGQLVEQLQGQDQTVGLLGVEAEADIV